MFNKIQNKVKKCTLAGIFGIQYWFVKGYHKKNLVMLKKIVRETDR